MPFLTALISNAVYIISLLCASQTDDFGNRILQNFQNEDRNFYVVLNNKNVEIGVAYYEVKRTADNRIELKTRTERAGVEANLKNVIETKWIFDEKGNPERCIRFRFIRDGKKIISKPVRELISFRDGKLNYESEFGRTKLVGSLNLRSGYFPFFGDSLDTWIIAAAIWHREMNEQQGSIINMMGKSFAEEKFRILLIHGEDYHLNEKTYNCTVFSIGFINQRTGDPMVLSQGPGSHPVLDSRAASEGYERIKFLEWAKEKRSNPFYMDAETRWILLKDSILNGKEGRPEVNTELYVADGRLISIYNSLSGRIVLKEPEVKTKATHEFVK